MLSLGSENGKNPEGHLSFNHLVSWEFGSLQDSNLGLKWLGRVLNKFPSLNLVQKKAIGICSTSWIHFIIIKG